MQLPTPAPVETPLIPVSRATIRACLALVGGLGGGATMALLALSVTVSTGDEAGRIAGGRKDGYAAALVSALAVDLSKPLR